jgi:hypothetical protein
MTEEIEKCNRCGVGVDRCKEVECNSPYDLPHYFESSCSQCGALKTEFDTVDCGEKCKSNPIRGAYRTYPIADGKHVSSSEWVPCCLCSTLHCGTRVIPGYGSSIVPRNSLYCGDGKYAHPFNCTHDKWAVEGLEDWKAIDLWETFYDRYLELSETDPNNAFVLEFCKIKKEYFNEP